MRTGRLLSAGMVLFGVAFLGFAALTALTNRALDVDFDDANTVIDLFGCGDLSMSDTLSPEMAARDCSVVVGGVALRHWMPPYGAAAALALLCVCGIGRVVLRE